MTPVLYLILWFALLAIAAGPSLLLSYQGYATAASVLATVSGVAWVLWTAYGLIRWHDVRWVGRVGSVLLGTAIAAALANAAWFAGSTPLLITVATIYAMGLSAYVGLLLAKAVLIPSHPIFGIARTTLDEAVRGKAALVAIVILVLFIPALPLMLDPSEPLKYRLQSFLAWSTIATNIVLGVMTVFLACWTITAEIRRKLVYASLTKPVARWHHLAGKWLGLALLNLVLIAVAGSAIYGTVRYLELEKYKLPPDHLDRIAVDEQVLVARNYTEPTPGNPGGMDALVDRYIAPGHRERPRRRPGHQTRGRRPRPHPRVVRHRALSGQTVRLPRPG